MKRILLVCNLGMSTSLLVSKMQKYAAEQGIECHIEANPQTNIKQYAGKFDVCLIGPQIHYAQPTITEALSPIPVEPIDMLVYGMADGGKALKQAFALLGEEI